VGGDQPSWLSCKSCSGGGRDIAWDLGIPFRLGMYVVRRSGDFFREMRAGPLRRSGSYVQTDTLMAEHYYFFLLSLFLRCNDYIFIEV
jgi:hypothetical protein